MPLHQCDHDRAGRPRIHAADPAGLPRDLRPVPHRLRQEVAAFRTLVRNHLAIRRERVGGVLPGLAPAAAASVQRRTSAPAGGSR
ncbi:hypothetical protein G6F32_016650 [Rhizopus arrhizus]|nr:hypothetical protein G6F32_016650 [Rhizopus arrhizus]